MMSKSLSWQALLVVCHLLTATAWATVPVFLGQNFRGSVLDINSSALPPDTDGAVGPNHFVEFINGRFSVYSKTNGTRVLTSTDLAFWSAAGVSLPGGYDLTDPRLVYDPSVQRWFAAQIDYDPTGVKNTNHFLFAISENSDPTGLWHGVVFPSDPRSVNFVDFPTVGLDAHAVYLGGDLFDSAQKAVGPILVSIPKSDLLAVTPTATNRTFFTNLNYSSNGQILQPAVCVDGTVNGTVIAVGDLFASSNLMALTILNGATATASLSAPTTINIPAYTVPINPPQPNGLSDLDDGDARFSAAVRIVGGMLYAAHGVQIGPRAALRWYRLNATTFAVLESGTISDPTLDLFYPSIAANSLGTIVIGCNGCSSNSFVSSYAFVGATSNGITTFNPPLLLKAGTASYQNIVTPDDTSRWGDYSATSPDPTDPTRFWTIQAIATGPQTWTTQVTEIITSQPALNITLANPNTILSWPAYAAAMQLQANSSVTNAATWNTVPQTRSTNGLQLNVTLPASNAASFFRLQLVP